MAQVVGEAVITVGADGTKFHSDLERDIGGTSTKSIALGTAVGDLLSRGVQAATRGLGLVVGTGFSTAMETEVANMKFAQLFKGQTDKAQGFIADLKSFAARTPFDFPGLQAAAGKFLAVGIEANRVIPIMTNLGDITSLMGTGAEGIDRATYALQQMATRGKVTGEEMMQLVEAGVPAWALLSESMGVPVDRLQKMVSDGLVPADAMFKALENTGGKTMSTFSGGMEKMSTTVTGKLSTLRDNFEQFAGRLVERALPAVSALADGLSNQVIPAVETAANWALGHLVPAVGALASAVMTVAVPAFTAIGAAVAATVRFFTEHELAARALGVVVAGVAAAVVAAWVAQGVAATVNAAAAVAGWFAQSAAATTSAGIQRLSTAQIVVGWVAAGAAAVAHAAVVVAQWALMGVQALLHAAKVAAAWVIAMGPVAWVTAAIIALVAVVIANFDTIREWITRAWEAVAAKTSEVWNGIASFFSSWWAGVTQRFNDQLNTIRGVLSGAWDAVRGVWETAWNGISNWFTSWWDGFTSRVRILVEAFTILFTAAWDAIRGLAEIAWNAISGVILGVWGAITAGVQAAVNTLTGILSAAWAAVRGAAEAAWNALRDWFTSWWGDVQARFMAAVEPIKNALSAAWNAIRATAEQVWNALRAWFDQWWAALTGFITAALEPIKNAIQAAWNAIQATTQQIWDAIRAWFQAWWSDVQARFNAFLETVKNLLNAAWTWIQTTTQAIWDAIRNWFSAWWADVTNRFNAFFEQVKALLNAAWEWIRNTTTAVWDAIRAWLAGWWSDVTNRFNAFLENAKSILTAAWNAISNTTTSVWNSIRDGLQSAWNTITGAFNTFTSGLGRIWDGIKAAFRDPINVVIRFLNAGLIGGYNKLNDLWGGSDWGTIQEIATGGPVRGHSPHKRADNILARLTAGEFVHPVDSVRYYGRGFMEAVRHRKIPKHAIGGYADGGMVAPINASHSGWGSYAGHTGLDYAAAMGTPVFAALAGVVTSVQQLATSYGHHIRIAHENGLETIYAHLSSIGVAVGQRVAAGQQIGGVGSTGNSTGPHLHFEVRSGGRAIDPTGLLAGAALPAGSTGVSIPVVPPAMLALFYATRAATDGLFNALPDAPPIAKAGKEFGRDAKDKLFAWMESMLPRVTLPTVGDLPPLAPGDPGNVDHWTRVIEQSFPGVRGSTYAGHQPSEALARDFMVGVAQGNQLAAFAQQNAAQMGLDYVIWQQRIWSRSRAAEGWRLMEDRGSPTQNHMDHVHVSWPAYAAGTWSARPGWGLVGERGPEWVRFKGGEQVLPNGRNPGATLMDVTVNVSVDDIERMGTVADFVRMLQRSRVDARRSQRSGVVAV